ncbi:MAG: TonB-dependent receptor [Sphingomonadaceae bacterium]|nr:TonB-dependent receptor [Sphingomonadaceae bacterium]
MTLSLFRNRLLATTIFCTAALPAFAADQPAAPAAQGAQPATPAAQEQPAAAESGDSQLIVVTGSLIRNPNLVAAQPVTVIGADELNLRQTNIAEETLRQLPGVVPSIGSAVNNGNGGASFVDLRGLGSFRNLVLIDGNRLVPSGLAGRFDLNNIPVALVQRLDVLTGGAAATYGADAVAGVINFITRKDFSGAELQISNSITGQGDGARFRADVTVGANTEDGRGNVTLSIGYQHFDPVYQGARNVSAVQYDSFSGLPAGSGTTTPSRIGLPALNPDGSPRTSGGAAIPSLGTRQINPALGAFNNDTSQIPFNFNPFNIFQTPFDRFNVFAQAHYEIFDGVELYTRALYSKNTVSTIIAPSGSFGTPVAFSLNNQFIPAGVRATFCERLGVTTAQCNAASTATGPGDPNYLVYGTPNSLASRVTLFRRTPETGTRNSNYTTQIFDYKAGLTGKITDTISWDVYGSYGESENRQVITGYTLNSRFRQGLLTTYNPVTGKNACVDPTGGCVPLNVFGPTGSILPDQVAFLTAAASTVTKTTLAQARGVISGEVPVASPFSTRAPSFAIGGEYRRYTGEQSADSLTNSGDLGGAGGAVQNIKGAFDVKEAFAELNVPVVEDRPFFRSLEIGGGVRYSSYARFDTTTWQSKLNWEPVEGLRLRGTYAQAARQPNLGELFAPQNTVLTNLANDPCASINDSGARIRPAPTGTLRDVCILQGATAATISNIPQPIAGQAQTTTGGNINLRPETSRSYSFGAVIAPRRVLPGFSLSIDFFDIKVSNAITSPTSGTVIASCFNNLSVTNPLCGPNSISRNPADGSLSGDPATTKGLFTNLQNLGRLETSGIDLTVNYQRDFGAIRWASSFAGTYTIKNRGRATVGDPPVSGVAGTTNRRECVNFISTNCGSPQPEYQWNMRNTFTWKDVDLSLLWNHISPLRQEPADVVNGAGPAFAGTIRQNLAGQLNGNPFLGQTVNFGRIPAYDYFDVTLRFNVTENASLSFTVQNLTDEQPPLVGNTIGSTTYNSGNTYPSTYDALGRRFTVQARVRF